MALTLKQPWATAIRELDKRVENRTWAPPNKAVGTMIAIHAGRTFDEEGADWVAARFGTLFASENVPLGSIIALAKLKGSVTSSESPWFVGPYGWEFSTVIPLAPVPCRGRLHLWPVPTEVQEQIMWQLR